MIIYDNFWKTMKEKGFSTYKLREEFGFHTDTISKLRNNGNLTTYTLDRLCTILDCELEDIAEFKKD